MTGVSDSCLDFEHHRFSGVRANLSADIVRYLTISPQNVALGDSFKRRLSALLRPELQSLTLHRIAHYLYVRNWRRAATLVSRFNFLLHKVYITPQSCIGPGCRLPHPMAVSFHGRAGRGLTLFSLGICCPRAPLLAGPVELGPTLGDRVTIGAHSVVIGPVTVGDDTKVAFSVGVNEDTPAGVLVVSRANRTVFWEADSHSRLDHTEPAQEQPRPL